MSGLMTAIPTGITAFIATNLDDLVILTLLFSQVDATFRRRHIVAGQYLGFTALVMASLLGFFCGLIIPEQWIGLLGLVPIAIGINQLFNNDSSSNSVDEEKQSSVPAMLKSFLAPQTFGVAAITFANGGDNIGIYLPLFANSDLGHLGIILVIFFVFVGLWCYLTYNLTRQPLLAEFLLRYGDIFVPFILMGLGSFLILDSHALSMPYLIFFGLGLFILLIVKINFQALNKLYRI
jgi:cadmium resistance transport/sequestration family protein